MVQVTTRKFAFEIYWPLSNHLIQLKFFQDSKLIQFLSLGPSPASSHHGSDAEEENENSHDSEEEERELKTAVENMGI